jgi:hypothetical protein
VSVLLHKPWAQVALVEGINANDAHFRVCGRDLPVGRLHVVEAEDEFGGVHVEGGGLAKRLVCNEAHVGETARGNRFTAPNKGAVMKAGLAIVDQANFVDHLRRSARLEDGESLIVASLLLALNYSVALQRSAPEVAVDQFVFRLELS